MRGRTTAVVLAGGSGTRFGAGRNKALLDLGGAPVLAWSLTALLRCPLVDDVLLVGRPGDRADLDALVAALPVPDRARVRGAVDGGASRHGSERRALEALAPDIAAGLVDVVAIHDAARPFLRQDLLRRLLESAATHGGSVPVLPVAAPLLLRPAPDGTVTGVPTGDLRGAQTPQAFRAAPLLEAYRRADADGFEGLDTAESVARYSDLTTVAVEGDPDNVKVTFAADLAAAAARAAEWDGDRPISRAGPPGPRGGG